MNEKLAAQKRTMTNLLEVRRETLASCLRELVEEAQKHLARLNCKGERVYRHSRIAKLGVEANEEMACIEATQEHLDTLDYLMRAGK
jgi:vacuolar-type H+-ATPase subunit D/Vma8